MLGPAGREGWGGIRRRGDSKGGGVANRLHEGGREGGRGERGGRWSGQISAYCRLSFSHTCINCHFVMWSRAITPQALRYPSIY